MKILSTLTLLLLSLCLFAQQVVDKKKKKEEDLPPEASTFQVQLHQDNGFGFYTRVKGSVGYDYKKSITFQALLFTNPYYGLGTNNPKVGSDLWLETSVGFSTSFFKKTLFVNPSIGVVSGKFLNGKDALVAEGIAPSLFLTYKKNAIDFEMQGNGFVNLRSFQSGGRGDHIWLQFYPGVKATKWLTVGAHLEDFSEIHPAQTNMYRWVGGFLKITIGDKYIMRMSAGRNLNNNNLYSSEFYKFSTVIPFL